MTYIAVDIGTSYIKGGIVDTDAVTLSEVRRKQSPSSIRHTEPLLHELDPSAIVSIVQHLIEELMSNDASCQGVLMCGQMSGLVLCSEDGRPLTNYISWRDGRCLMPHPSGEATYFDLFTERVGSDAQRRLGNEFRPGMPLAFLHWLHERHELPTDQPASPVTLPDFVAANLCGSRPVMEWTSTCGSLDVASLSFPDDLIEALGLGDLQWPEIVDYKTLVGECHIGGKHLPVYAPVGDQQCALAGMLLMPGELSVNIATGSQLAMISDTADVGECQVRAYFDGQFLRTISHVPAGRALTVIMDLLTEISANQGLNSDGAWDCFFEQAEATECSDLEVNLALFPSPIPGPGGILNMREDNVSVGHIARACFEQMSAYYEMLSRRIEPNRDWQRIVLSGGISNKSDLLRRRILDRLGGDYRLAAEAEDTLLGLMVLGRVIDGQNETVADAARHVTRERR
jgi:xylulokinase